MKLRFPSAKDPAETVPLTFDFSASLSSSESVLAVTSITICCPSGLDPAPQSMLTGEPALVPSSAVVVPVGGGMDGTEYEIKVVVSTSNPMKILAMTGILRVAS